MTRKIKYIIITLIAAWSVNAAAQNSQVLYYMRIPQSHLMNPAIKPANLFYLGLPFPTSITAGFSNNFLNMNDFIQGDTISDWPPPDFDLNKFAGSLKERNTIAIDANIQLFGLGFMIGRDLNLFIDVIDRVEAKGVIPKDLLDLYINGYDQFLNKTISLSGLNLRAQYFREIGFGFSKNVTAKLRVGAKAKILFGVASLNLDNRALTLKVNSDFTQTITADATLDVSGKERLNILKNDFSSGGKIFQFYRDYIKTPFSNPGLGVDLGAVYNFNKMFSVSAAITDLGYINWKKDLKSFVAKNTFDFQGFSLKDVMDNNVSIDSLIKGIADTVKNSFIENANPLAFKTNLPAIISVGANLNLSTGLTFGVLSQSKIYAGQIRESLTLSGNAYLGRTFSASLSYTMANYIYNNFGLGIAFKAGPGQIYLVADKIPLQWSKLYVKTGDSKYSGIPIPDNWNMLNVQLGFNISFGKVVSKKVDKPMVIVE